MQDSEVSLANTAQATMKLRFKGEDCALGGTSKGFSLQVDDNCDWCQLQEAISRQCPYLERFSLSLNKRVSSFIFCAQTMMPEVHHSCRHLFPCRTPCRPRYHLNKDLCPCRTPCRPMVQKR